MNLDLWLRLLTFVVLIGSTVVNVFLYWKARNDKRFAELREGGEKLGELVRAEAARRSAADNELATRVSVLEEWRKHVPTDEDIAEIRREMADQGQQITSIAERSEITLASVKRIEDYLLRGKA